MEYIFYEIKCNDESITDFYIGSTKNFTRRKCQHKNRCNNYNDKSYNLKIYCTIRDNGGWDNWTMNPIDKQIFETKIDARIYENKIITERQATLNIYKAFATKEERKEYIKKYNKTDKNKEYQKNYRLKKKLEKENLIGLV